MKIGIIGCSGRMGKALIEETYINDNFTLTGGVVKNESALKGIDLGTIAALEPIGINTSSNIEELINQSDAIIDFTNPSTTLECAKISSAQEKTHIIGTTGFTNEQIDKLKQYAQNTRIIWSSNMSIGVNILSSLTEKLASILDDTFDIEIVEMHHCHKADAPSGTALMLGEAAANGRNVNLDDVATKSREGIIGPRTQGEIGFSTIRGGDVVGDHTVIFAGDGERIELSHKASSRKIFAKGALKAALWAKSQKHGLYNMHDVLK